MEKLRSIISQVLLNPANANSYSAFLKLLDSWSLVYMIGKQPKRPSFGRMEILLLNVVALVPFWIVAILTQMNLELVAVLSVLLLTIGFLLGSIHMTLGAVAILGLGFLVGLNPIWQQVEIAPISNAWPLVLLAIFLPAAFFVQMQAQSAKRPIDHWWRLFFALIVILSTSACMYLTSGQHLSAGYIWAVLALAGLALASVVKTSRDTTNISADAVTWIGGITLVMSSIGMGWQLFPAIFAPGQIAWLNVIFRILFTTLMLVVAIVASVFDAVLNDFMSDESKREIALFRVRRWLFLGLFLILAIQYDVPHALLTAFIAVILYSLSVPITAALSEGSSLPRFAVTAMVVALVSSFASFALVQESSWRAVLFELFTPQLPTMMLRSIPGWFLLLLCISVVLTFSGMHWSTLVMGGTMLLTLVLSNAPSSSGNSLPIILGIGGGALIGALRMLSWPLLSLVTRQEQRRVEQSIQAKGQSCWFAVDLLETICWPPPLGHQALQKALTRKTLPSDAFVTKRARNRYKAARIRWSVQTISSTADLETILREDLSSLSPVLRSAIERFSKARQLLLDISRARAYAAQIETLNASIKKGPIQYPEENLVTQEEIHALRHLVSLAFDDIRPAAEAYWATYGVFPKDPFSGSAPPDESGKVAGPTAELDVEREWSVALISHRIARISELERAMRPVGNLLAQLPAEEQGYYETIQRVALRVPAITRTLDYPQRLRDIQTQMERVEQVRHDLKSSWQTISATEPKVIEHPSPWAPILTALYDDLGQLTEWHSQYVERIESRIVAILESVQTVEELAGLRRQLDPISSFGDRYGPMLDETLRRLNEISGEAAAALASPKGYTQHLGLQDALNRVNELRSDLSRRFLLEAQRLMASLNHIADLLHESLFVAIDAQSTALRNPYVVSTAIGLARRNLFKGRTEIAERIAGILRSGGRPALILHGPRRMGKTSFLLQLPRLLRPNFVPIFLDAQEAGCTENDSGFLFMLANSIHRQLGSKLQITIPDDEAFSAQPYINFTRWLDALMPLLNQRVLFYTIDEFELIGSAIREGRLTEHILGTLRHLMQHNDRIAFLFAGVQTLEGLGPNAASYFISAYPIEISYLSRIDAEELIRLPDPAVGKMPDYDDDVVAEMLRLTRCQPYLIQALCSEIINVANTRSLTRIDSATLAQIITPVLSATASNYFNNMWDDADIGGQRALRMLVGGPQTLDERSFSPGVLEDLLKRHVIEKLANGTYDIEIPLAREWVRRKIG